MASDVDPTIDQEDVRDIVRYVDGIMSMEEQLDFEVRLSSDPRLAAATEDYADANDALLEAWPRAEAPAVRSRRPLVWTSLVAAAAVIVLAIRFGWGGVEEAPPRFGVFDAFDVAYPELPPLTVRSDASAQSRATRLEWREQAARIESEAARSALAAVSPRRGVESSLVAVELERPAYVLVLSRSLDGPVRRHYPDPALPRDAWSALGRGLHVLPGSWAELVESPYGGSELHRRKPRFVDFAEATSYEVVVASSATRPSSELLRQIDELGQSGPPGGGDDWSAWLEDRGFVAVTAIIEPSSSQDPRP